MVQMGKSVLALFRDGVSVIKINRPKLRNAINTEVFQTITNILKRDALNEAVVVTVLTSVGNVFSSGLEINLNGAINIEVGEAFVRALIDYPKILIAVIQGPAVGVAVTMLPLFDIVYASDRASFVVPFIHFGFNPEAGSSYMFPRLMGRSKAMEMLLLGEKISAQHALNANLISKIVSHEEIDGILEKITLSVGSVKNVKHLIKVNLKDHLHQVVTNEIDTLRKNFHSVHTRAAKEKKIKKSKL